MNKEAYKRRKAMVLKALAVPHMPPVIVGINALGLAAVALGDGTREGLIRYMLDFKRDVLKTLTPGTEEYAAVEMIEKELEDLELEESMLMLET